MGTVEPSRHLPRICLQPAKQTSRKLTSESRSRVATVTPAGNDWECGRDHSINNYTEQMQRVQALLLSILAHSHTHTLSLFICIYVHVYIHIYIYMYTYVYQYICICDVPTSWLLLQSKPSEPWPHALGFRPSSTRDAARLQLGPVLAFLGCCSGTYFELP